MSESFKVLVIDDEVKLLEVIESYLLKEGFKVFKAKDGESGVELFYKESPDLVVLDLMLPDMSGEEICKNIRKVSNVPIIMLTAKSEEHNILNGLDLGADDYITKPFSPRQLVARIKAVLRRYSNSFGETLNFDNDRLIIDLNEHSVKLENQIISLTPVEFKLLITFAKNPSKVFSREELVSLVLGYDYDGFDRTIDVHIKNLRGKLGESKNPKFILTVFGIGYKFGR